MITRKQYNRKSRLIQVVCGLLIFLLVYTALSKLVSFTEFKLRLRLQPGVGEQYNVVAVVLPVAELLVAAMLLIPRFRKTGLWLAVLMMGFFTAYTGYLIAFKADRLPCACGGIISALSWRGHFFVNLGFLVIAMLALQYYYSIKDFVATIADPSSAGVSARHRRTPVEESRQL